MQTLRVTHKRYSLSKIHHAKYTNFSSILNLATFSVNCAVKSHVYHVKYTNFSSILNLATFSVHCALKSHVYHVKYTDFI